MLFAVAAVLVLYAAVEMARAAHLEWRDFHPRRSAIVRPDDAPVDLSEVAFPSPDGSALRGWWLPSRNGAAVVFVHGTSGDRRGLYPQALFLHQHGFGALLFDMPGHGESTGEVHWTDEARAAVRAALRFSGAQSGVSTVGAYGFSMGAYTVAQVAGGAGPAGGPGPAGGSVPAGGSGPAGGGLAFAVLDGVPSDAEELTKWQYRRLGPLTGMAGVWTDRLCGFHPEPMPVETISRYSGPLFFIIGQGDEVVPAAMQEAVARAAPATPRICRTPSAHGDWMEQGDNCRASLLGFLEERAAPSRSAEAR